ncbi:MAG: CBS domain-containing protein [Proteobacteria bacterium]|nr:CBS domain-containing protein [Pseudomonadota bacterium]
MTILEERKTLSGLTVGNAMRRQVVYLPQHTSIDKGINALIKYKVNALLTTNADGGPAGVVSKTDIMGAYYAGLLLETPLQNIMSSPPLFCRPDDSLESALEKMRSKGIYRLYVLGEGAGDVVGALAYPDIVGMLYRYCHECKYSHRKHKPKNPADAAVRRFKVKEVMTASVKACLKNDSLMHIMEELSKYRFGAVLITEKNGTPCGVVSKTDLTLSYKHGIDALLHAQTIMSSPVRSCEENGFLEDAIKKMILTDVHRLFVHRSATQNIVGVLSLTDAARLRSGSCHACVSSRIKIDHHQ